MARSIREWGSEATLIWKLTRSTPPRLSLTERIFAATVLGSSISKAPVDPRRASKWRPVTGG